MIYAAARPNFAQTGIRMTGTISGRESTNSGHLTYGVTSSIAEAIDTHKPECGVTASIETIGLVCHRWRIGVLSMECTRHTIMGEGGHERLTSTWDTLLGGFERTSYAMEDLGRAVWMSNYPDGLLLVWFRRSAISGDWELEKGIEYFEALLTLLAPKILIGCEQALGDVSMNPLHRILCRLTSRMGSRSSP